jgi:hypothetical protein
MPDAAVAVAACLIAACGGGTSEIPNPPPGLDLSWVLDGCAPWDGAATTIYLAGTKPEDVLSAPYPHVWVSLYYPRSELPGRTLTWTADERNVGGAMWCVAEGECQLADQARVRVRRGKLEDVVLPGEVHLEFPDGTTIDGSFEAEVVDAAPLLCG